jgi:hypothetical protein
MVTEGARFFLQHHVQIGHVPGALALKAKQFKYVANI